MCKIGRTTLLRTDLAAGSGNTTPSSCAALLNRAAGHCHCLTICAWLKLKSYVFNNTFWYCYFTLRGNFTLKNKKNNTVSASTSTIIMINDVFMLSAQSVAVSVSVRGSLFCLSQIMQFLIDKKSILSSICAYVSGGLPSRPTIMLISKYKCWLIDVPQGIQVDLWHDCCIKSPPVKTQ